MTPGEREKAARVIEQLIKLDFQTLRVDEGLLTAMLTELRASCGYCRWADGNSIGVDWFYCMQNEHYVDRNEYCTRYEKEDEE